MTIMMKVCRESWKIKVQRQD